MDSNEFNNNEFYSEQTSESYEEIAPSKGAIFAEKIRAMFASKAFLTATIAYTVMAGASLIWGSIDVFAVLFTIGMWLAYTSASKSNFPLKDMKFLSGVLKAYYIVAIIGIVCLIVSGIILIVMGPSIMKAESEIQNIIQTLDQNVVVNWSSFAIDGEATFSSFADAANYISTTLEMNVATFIGMFMVIFGVIFIISAVVMIIINEFFINKLRKQMKKAIDALASGTDAELRLGGIRGWFITIGVFAAISALSVLTSFDPLLLASEGASAVACFAIAEALKDKEASQNTVQPML